MKEDFFHKEGARLARVLPIYLAVQGAVLILTFLDSPAYTEAYQAHHYLTVSPWVGGWLMLELFGLPMGIILLFGRPWREVFDRRERIKLSAGYFLGVLAGLVTLGLRFMPVFPQEYFIYVGGVILLGILVYVIWTRRQTKLDEIFP